MRDCDDMESWMIQKEAIVKTEEKGGNKDRVESMQKKFDVRILECYNQFEYTNCIFLHRTL